MTTARRNFIIIHLVRTGLMLATGCHAYDGSYIAAAFCCICGTALLIVDCENQ